MGQIIKFANHLFQAVFGRPNIFAGGKEPVMGHTVLSHTTYVFLCIGIGTNSLWTSASSRAVFKIDQ